MSKCVCFTNDTHALNENAVAIRPLLHQPNLMHLLPPWMLLKSDIKEKWRLSSKRSVGRSFLASSPEPLTAQLISINLAPNIVAITLPPPRKEIAREARSARCLSTEAYTSHSCHSTTQCSYPSTTLPMRATTLPKENLASAPSIHTFRTTPQASSGFDMLATSQQKNPRHASSTSSSTSPECYRWRGAVVRRMSGKARHISCRRTSAVRSSVSSFHAMSKEHQRCQRSRSRSTGLRHGGDRSGNMLLQPRSRAEVMWYSTQATTAQPQMKPSLTRYSLESIGSIKSREPQRFYSYALSDPKDEPFACFRYYCLAHGTSKVLLSELR